MSLADDVISVWLGSVLDISVITDTVVQLENPCCLGTAMDNFPLRCHGRKSRH